MLGERAAIPERSGRAHWLSTVRARAARTCSSGPPGRAAWRKPALWLLVASFCTVAPSTAEDDRPALLDETALVGRLLSIADERLALMPAVAAAKWPRHLPITDAGREQEVLRDAAARAASAGLASDAVVDFFALQMSFARALQQHYVDRWTATGFDSPASTADLAGELRPRLDAITRDSLLELYLVAPFAADPGFAERAARVAAVRLPAERWSDPNRAALVAAIARVRLALPSSPERARGAGVIRFGTPGDYAPFSVAGEDDLEGTDVELAQRLARELGLRPVFIRSSWHGLGDDLVADRFDVAVGGVSVTGPRAEIGSFSVATGRSGKTAIGRCADSRRYARFEDIDRPSVRVVFNPGGTNDAFVHHRLTRARLLAHDDNRTIFDDLESRRADVMFTDETEVALATRRHPGLCRLIPDAFEPADKAFLMPKTGGWQAWVDPWLRREVAAGTPARLLEQYLAH